MRRSYRLLVIVLLVVAVLGLGVHYAGAYDDNWPYPTSTDIAEQPEAYAGEQVLLIEEVTQLDAGTGEATLTLDGEGPGEPHDLSVDLDGVDVETGGVVQVYGVLGQDGSKLTEVIEVVVVEAGSSDTRFKYLVSAIGLVFVAGFFLWHWRIDWRSLQFAQRGETDG